VSAAEFYAEDLGLAPEVAARISWAMTVAPDAKAIEKRTPWAKHGKARVYFDLWSQNSLAAVPGFDRCYYDGERDDAFVAGYFYGRTLERPISDLLWMDRGNFSGAKTRAALREFAEVFYEQKAARG
jgi:hypothetical protein